MSAPVSEQGAALTIEAACRTLRLPTVREVAASLAEAAVRDRLTHLAYLAEVLGAELDDRDARRRERRIAEARFPRLKRLAEFDLAAAPSVSPALLASLETGAWIDAGEPVVLLGDSGTGKSHLLIGLGLAACEQAVSQYSIVSYSRRPMRWTPTPRMSSIQNRNTSGSGADQSKVPSGPTM